MKIKIQIKTNSISFPSQLLRLPVCLFFCLVSPKFVQLFCLLPFFFFFSVWFMISCWPEYNILKSNAWISLFFIERQNSTIHHWALRSPPSPLAIGHTKYIQCSLVFWFCYYGATKMVHCCIRWSVLIIIFIIIALLPCVVFHVHRKFHSLPLCVCVCMCVS